MFLCLQYQRLIRKKKKMDDLQGNAYIISNRIRKKKLNKIRKIQNVFINNLFE